jgi:hypothetical protein
MSVVITFFLIINFIFVDYSYINAARFMGMHLFVMCSCINMQELNKTLCTSTTSQRSECFDLETKHCTNRN